MQLHSPKTLNEGFNILVRHARTYMIDNSVQASLSVKFSLTAQAKLRAPLTHSHCTLYIHCNIHHNFLFIIYLRWPSYLPLPFSGTQCLSLPCTFSLAFHLFLQLFVNLPQITTLPSCFSFALKWICSFPPVQYHRPLSIVLQAQFTRSNVLNLFITSTVHS